MKIRIKFLYLLEFNEAKSENSNYNKDKKYKDEPATVNCCF